MARSRCTWRLARSGCWRWTARGGAGPSGGERGPERVHGNIETEEANAFDQLRSLEAEGARFDVVVLDPPAFAKHRSSLGRAVRGYKEINLRGMRLLAPGGHLLTFSCSYHVGVGAFREMLARRRRTRVEPFDWVSLLGQASDHPVILQIPETGYLKGALLQAVD
jgi:23S rRNA (cytosine1962-C5)-methyltransferase